MWSPLDVLPVLKKLGLGIERQFHPLPEGDVGMLGRQRLAPLPIRPNVLVRPDCRRRSPCPHDLVVLQLPDRAIPSVLEPIGLLRIGPGWGWSGPHTRRR